MSLPIFYLYKHLTFFTLILDTKWRDRENG